MKVAVFLSLAVSAAAFSQVRRGMLRFVELCEENGEEGRKTLALQRASYLLAAQPTRPASVAAGITV